MCSTALADWVKDLPSSLQIDLASPGNAMPHILMMHLSHAWLVILLHRPYYRPLARLPGREAQEEHLLQSGGAWAVNVSFLLTNGTHPQFCDRAAVHVIDLLQLWDKAHDLRFCPPTAIQICFVSGTTHLLSLASTRSNSHRQAESFGRVQECGRLLGRIARSWPSATQTKILLESLRDEYGFSIGPPNENKASELSNLTVPPVASPRYGLIWLQSLMIQIHPSRHLSRPYRCGRPYFGAGDRRTIPTYHPKQPESSNAPIPRRLEFNQLRQRLKRYDRSLLRSRHGGTA